MTTRTQVLVQLVTEQPLLFGQLRELTGWSERRLSRGLEVATGPNGLIGRDKTAKGWAYRLATTEEREAASAASSARRRAAKRKQDAMRGLRQGGKGPQGVCGLQPGLFHVWGPLPVVPATDADSAGAEEGAAAIDAGHLGAARAQRGGAARSGQAQLGGVGA